MGPKKDRCFFSEAAHFGVEIKEADVRRAGVAESDRKILRPRQACDEANPPITITTSLLDRVLHRSPNCSILEQTLRSTQPGLSIPNLLAEGNSGSKK
jgi:hypothetical protein